MTARRRRRIVTVVGITVATYACAPAAGVDPASVGIMLLRPAEGVTR